MVKVYTSDYSSGPYGASSYPDFLDYREQATSFTGLAAYTPFSPMNVELTGDAQRANGGIVTGEFFDVLQVTPLLGRFFRADENATPGTQPVVLLSYGIWRTSFGGDPDIVGHRITVNGAQFTVAGVAPAEFTGVELIAAPSLWLPMAMLEQAAANLAGRGILDQRGSRWLQMVGRLRETASPQSARVELSTIAARLADAHPSTNLGTLQQPDIPRPIALLPANALAIGPVNGLLLTRVGQLLLAVVGIVLLIACANVASLLLARASARHGEIAIRQSLGAGRGRLIRQLLAESLLLASIGGVVGLGVGVWATGLFSALVPQEASQAGITLPAFDVDWRVGLFTAGVSLFAGVVFGLAPAIQTTRPDLVPALKEGTTGVPLRGSCLRYGLFVGQVAMSLFLLIGAGLFVRSLQTALATDPGFDSRRVLLADLDLSLHNYGESQGQNFYRSLLDRARALPGVQSASLARVVPVSPSGSRTTVEIEGYAPDPREDMELNLNVVEASYFDAMGIAFVQGSSFSPMGTAGRAGEVIVNRAFTERYWPGQDPLGRGITFGGDDPPDRVVGVVQDSKYRSLREERVPYIYRPVATNYSSALTLLVRARGDPMTLAPAIRSRVRELDSGLPAFGL